MYFVLQFVVQYKHQWERNWVIVFWRLKWHQYKDQATFSSTHFMVCRALVTCIVFCLPWVAKLVFCAHNYSSLRSLFFLNGFDEKTQWIIYMPKLSHSCWKCSWRHMRMGLDFSTSTCFKKRLLNLFLSHTWTIWWFNIQLKRFLKEKN